MWTMLLAQIHVSNVLKSHVYFKVTVDNIQNPDETREKRGSVRFHCLGGARHVRVRVGLTSSDAVPSRSARRLLAEGRGGGRAERLCDLIIAVLPCCSLPWQHLSCLFPRPVSRPGQPLKVSLGG